MAEIQFFFCMSFCDQVPYIQLDTATLTHLHYLSPPQHSTCGYGSLQVSEEEGDQLVLLRASRERVRTLPCFQPQQGKWGAGGRMGLRLVMSVCLFV